MKKIHDKLFAVHPPDEAFANRRAFLLGLPLLFTGLAGEAGAAGQAYGPIGLSANNNGGTIGPNTTIQLTFTAPYAQSVLFSNFAAIFRQTGDFFKSQDVGYKSFNFPNMGTILRHNIKTKQEKDISSSRGELLVVVLGGTYYRGTHGQVRIPVRKP